MAAGEYPDVDYAALPVELRTFGIMFYTNRFHHLDPQLVYGVSTN